MTTSNHLPINELLKDDSNIDTLREIYESFTDAGYIPDDSVKQYLQKNARYEDLIRLKSLEIPYLSAWAFDEMIHRDRIDAKADTMLYGY